MRCISPFDNGSYHMVTIRTNRTNRQLGEGSLTIQAPRNILSPPNEMHFSIRQRVVSHGHDPYESNESTTRRRVSRHAANEMHFSIRQRVLSTNAHLLRIDDSKATQQLFLRIVSIQVYWTTLNKKKVYNTRYFQAVNHPGTILARQGLTSGIERVPVFFLVVWS